MGQNGDHWINETQEVTVPTFRMGPSVFYFAFWTIQSFKSGVGSRVVTAGGSYADYRNEISMACRRRCRCRYKLPRSAKTKQGCQNRWGGTWFLDLICANRQWFRSVVPWRVPESQWLSLQGWRCLCNFLAADCHLPCVLIIIRMFEVPVVPLLP